MAFSMKMMSGFIHMEKVNDEILFYRLFFPYFKLYQHNNTTFEFTDVCLRIVVCVYGTFDNSFVIKSDYTKYLKEICR